MNTIIEIHGGHTVVRPIGVRIVIGVAICGATAIVSAAVMVALGVGAGAGGVVTFAVARHVE